MWNRNLSMGGYPDYAEGYMALLIAIDKAVPHGLAFDILSGENYTRIRRPPEWFIQEVDEMLADGMKKQDIAANLRLSPSALTHTYRRMKRILEEKNVE